MKENFSKRVQLIIKQSKEEAIRLGHSYVGSEHLLIGLLKEESGLAKKVIDVFDIDSNDMIAMVEDMIKSSGGTMTLGHLPLTRRAERILRNAYNEATKRNESIADDEHVLLALLLESEGIARDILKSFSLDYDTVNDLIGSNEEDDSLSSINKSKESSEKSTTPTLDHFSRDIIQLAKKGKLDPVIGRESEIERVAQILTRRKKNNPVLIGEPGVGKTAIIEGLAQRIVRKTVPRILHKKRILSLDLASIVAGTKYRGQFEERLKSLMIELKKNNSSFRKAIFMEQEETRAIRTEDWLYMERINNKEMPFLSPELYDLRNDPLEYKNLSEEIKYKSIIETLSKKLHDYFKSHSNPKFDLWNGGKAKSNVSSEAFWKQIWGEDWSCTY